MSANPKHLIIAGVPKAGTSSLFQALSCHPSIEGSRVKETEFFLPIRYGEGVPNADHYESFFSGASIANFRLEATPGYFYGGASLAMAINESLPGARIVILLRDPVERFFSHFKYFQSKLRIAQSTTAAEYLDWCIGAEPGLASSRENEYLMGLEGGCYREWASEWIEVFGDRVRFVFFDDLVDRPMLVCESILDWLGLSIMASAIPRRENVTRNYRSAFIHKAVMRIYRASEGFLRSFPLARDALRRAYNRLNRKPFYDLPDPYVVRRLEVYYGEMNRGLDRIVEPYAFQGLPGWCQRSSSMKGDEAGV